VRNDEAACKYFDYSLAAVSQTIQYSSQSPLPRLMVNSLNSNPAMSFSFLNLQSDILDCGLPVVLNHSFISSIFLTSPCIHPTTVCLLVFITQPTRPYRNAVECVC